MCNRLLPTARPSMIDRPSARASRPAVCRHRDAQGRVCNMNLVYKTAYTLSPSTPTAATGSQYCTVRVRPSHAQMPPVTARSVTEIASPRPPTSMPLERTCHAERAAAWFCVVFESFFSLMMSSTSFFLSSSSSSTSSMPRKTSSACSSSTDRPISRTSSRFALAARSRSAAWVFFSRAA